MLFMFYFLRKKLLNHECFVCDQGLRSCFSYVFPFNNGFVIVKFGQFTLEQISFLTIVVDTLCFGVMLGSL
jgi:hypothetical protein